MPLKKEINQTSIKMAYYKNLECQDWRQSVKFTKAKEQSVIFGDMLYSKENMQNHVTKQMQRNSPYYWLHKKL